ARAEAAHAGRDQRPRALHRAPTEGPDRACRARFRVRHAGADLRDRLPERAAGGGPDGVARLRLRPGFDDAPRQGVQRPDRAAGQAGAEVAAGDGCCYAVGGLRIDSRGHFRSPIPGGVMNFDIKTEQLSDDAYVISLAGEVDLYTAPEFKQQLLEVIGQGAKEVVVDFTDTTFIDSTTLGVLVGGVKRLRANDGQLALVCSARHRTTIFEITGLDRVSTTLPSRDEAIAALSSSGATA